MRYLYMNHIFSDAHRVTVYSRRCHQRMGTLLEHYIYVMCYAKHTSLITGEDSLGVDQIGIARS